METQLYQIKHSGDLFKEFRKIIREELSENQKKDEEPPKEEFPFVKIDVITKSLGISKNTVYQWVRLNLIKKYKINSRTYFDKNEIIDFMKFQNK